MYTRKVLALMCALYSCPALSQEGINQPRRALRAGATRSFSTGQTTESRNWVAPVARRLPGNGANANGDVTTNANGGGWTTATTNGANGGSGSVTDSEGNGVSWSWGAGGINGGNQGNANGNNGNHGTPESTPAGSTPPENAGGDTTVTENSTTDPVSDPMPAEDFSSSFGFDDQHAGGSGLPLDPASADPDAPGSDFSASFGFDDDHAAGAAVMPDSSMDLPPIDNTAVWNIRLVIAGKRGITNLDESLLGTRCTALLGELGYTGTCTFKWSDKTPTRRRLPWDTTRLLQGSTVDCGSDVYYTPVSLTGDVVLSYDNAKAFALGSDFPSLFEGSNLYCGVKSWDFKTNDVEELVPELACDSNVVVSLPADQPLYYTITPSAAGTVSLSTCDAATDVDTALDVFTSDPRADTTLQPAASNQDDTNCAVNAAFSSLSVTASAGQTLYVRVSGTSAYGGSISLTSTCSVY